MELIWASPLCGRGAHLVSGVKLLERACDLGFHIRRHDGRPQVSLWAAGSASSLALIFDAKGLLSADGWVVMWDPWEEFKILFSFWRGGSEECRDCGVR